MADAKAETGRIVDKIIQQALGVLFGVAFIAALLGIFLYPGSKASFTTVLIDMAVAIIVVAVLPSVEEFGVGPKGVNAKLRRVEERLNIQREVLTEQPLNDLLTTFRLRRNISDG